MLIIEFLADLFQTDPAVVVVVSVVIVIILGFKIAGMTKRGPVYTYSGNQAIDAINKALADFKFLEEMGNLGKKIFRNSAQRIIEGKGGFQDILVIFILVVIIAGVLFSAADHFGAIKPPSVVESQDAWVVGEDETCVRNGVEVPKFEKKQAWDVCNGQTIMPTTIPPTTAPTLTAIPPSPSPEVQSTPVVVIASATPAPTEQPGKLVKVVWLDGHSTEQGWMSVPNLNGYTQIAETKCLVYDTPPLQIPTEQPFAFVLFEGGRKNFLITDSLVNLSSTKLTLNMNNQVEIEGCQPGSWFSLWVND